MSESTLKGYWRQKGTKGATPAVGLLALTFSFDPTQSSAGVGKVLPKGAIPLSVANLNGGATGGTNPTVDIGTSGDSDGFSNELDADGATAPVITGALLGAELTEDTEIYAGVGASAATGGSVTAMINFIMADDGS